MNKTTIVYDAIRPGDTLQAGDQYKADDGRWCEVVIPLGKVLTRADLTKRQHRRPVQYEEETTEQVDHAGSLSSMVFGPLYGPTCGAAILDLSLIHI